MWAARPPYSSGNVVKHVNPPTSTQHGFSNTARCHPAIFFLRLCKCPKWEHVHGSRCFMQGRQTNNTCAICFFAQSSCHLNKHNCAIATKNPYASYRPCERRQHQKHVFMRNNNCGAIMRETRKPIFVWFSTLLATTPLNMFIVWWV